MAEYTQGWIKRPAAAVIDISGEDSADFLQSQFSADLRMSEGQFKEGLWLNHRARIEGESCILKLAPERFLLVSRSTPAGTLMAKLDRHIISEEVELSDLTSASGLILVYGSRSHLTELGLGISEATQEDVSVYQESCYILPFLNAAQPSVMIFGALDALSAMYSKVEASAFSKWNEAEYKRFRMEKGVCEIPLEVGPEETPAEVGLSGLCSLQKGCYLGQEVVNRQARLERASKKLVRLRLSAPAEDAKPSASPRLPIYLDEQGVGDLRGSTEEAPFRGLAMLKTKALEGDLRLGSVAGMEIEVIDD